MAMKLANGVLLGGDARLAPHLGAAATPGLVFDASASDPAGWEELERLLAEVYVLTREAVLAEIPIVYVVHEPSVWGHTPPLRSALATALLGGMRSAAVELGRKGLVANAVAVASEDEPARVCRSVAFLLEGDLSGQVLTCGTTHLGRPAA